MNSQNNNVESENLTDVSDSGNSHKESFEANAEMLADAAGKSGIATNGISDAASNDESSGDDEAIATSDDTKEQIGNDSDQDGSVVDDNLDGNPDSETAVESSTLAESEKSEKDSTSENTVNTDEGGSDSEEPEESVNEKSEAEEEAVIKCVTSDEGVEVTVESVIEAVLFACDEPVTPNKLVGIIGAGSVRQIRDRIKDLNTRYQESNSSFRIEKIAGGYQMMTLDAYNHWLRKLIKVRADNKLTQAALETLSIIAYKQPIIRADVEAIRGVSSGEMIRSLMSKGLVKITGRAEVIGRPMLYGTTRKFLDVFGLNSTKDLPKIEELKKTDS